MPNTISSASRLTRLFKPDPFRDLFRVLADTLADAVVVLSGDSKHMLASNHAFTLLTGYARAELSEFPFQKLLPSEVGKKTIGKILRAWDNPDCHLQDIPFRTREGTITLVDMDVRAIGSSGSALLLTCQPAINRLRRVEKQRAQQERLNTMVALTALLLDDQEGNLSAILELSRPLLAANTIGLYRVAPSSPDYIREGPLPEEFPATLPISAIDLLRPVTLWSLGHRTEHLLQKAARSAGLASLRTSPLGSSAAWIGVLVAGWRDQNEMPDEAERWMAFVANLCHAVVLREMQLEKSQSLQGTTQQLQAEIEGQFSSASDSLLTLNKDLCILRANPAAGDMLGYHPEELIGLPIQEVLVGPKDVRSTFLDALGHEREAKISRLTIHRRNGTPFPVQLRVRPLPKNSHARLLVALQDRSEQEAIEDKTEILAQRALLGEVTAIFAHEIRNPINNISTGIQLVSSRLGKDHAQYDSLDRVRKECDRLNQLLSDVLFFARPLELKMVPLDLTEMIERLLVRWEPRFTRSNISVHTEYHPDVAPALADPRTFEQVLLNVITNALQAMPDGGTISITLESLSNAQGEMVELKIADTGPGIPPDMIERIFDPFFSTKKDGTGLGLAISRRILAAHKGTIDVESFLDAGTVFSIRVPTAEKPS